MYLTFVAKQSLKTLEPSVAAGSPSRVSLLDAALNSSFPQQKKMIFSQTSKTQQMMQNIKQYYVDNSNIHRGARKGKAYQAMC